MDLPSDSVIVKCMSNKSVIFFFLFIFIEHVNSVLERFFFVFVILLFSSKLKLAEDWICINSILKLGP